MDETRRVTVALIEAVLAMTPDRQVVEQGSALLRAVCPLIES